MFPCRLQRMLASSTVVIFIELPMMHWHFDPMLNASVLTIQIAMRIYMFHSRQFHVPMMSPFFRPHKPYDDITLDNVHPPFHPPMYPTYGESNSDTRLTLTMSMEFDPSGSSYSTYSMGSYRSEPSQPSIVFLSSDSSASSVGLAPPPVCSHGFIRTRAIPRTCGHGGGCGDDAPSGFRNE